MQIITLDSSGSLKLITGNAGEQPVTLRARAPVGYYLKLINGVCGRQRAQAVKNSGVAMSVANGVGAEPLNYFFNIL